MSQDGSQVLEMLLKQGLVTMDELSSVPSRQAGMVLMRRVIGGAFGSGNNDRRCNAVGILLAFINDGQAEAAEIIRSRIPKDVLPFVADRHFNFCLPIDLEILNGTWPVLT